MVKEVSLAYMTTFLLSLAGYAMIGGSFWMWCIAAWLIGAPVTLAALWVKIKLVEINAWTRCQSFGAYMMSGFYQFYVSGNRTRY